MEKPRIIGGICEFCGIRADECVHYGKVAKTPEKPRIEIKPVEQRPGDALKKKAADVIIAHWDRRDMLYQTLGSLPLSGLNVVVVRGSTYSVANNLGSLAAVTDNLIFCNDDMIVPRQALFEMIDCEADFAMARQFYPDGSPQHCGIKWLDNDFVVVADPAEADCPTAACFRVKRSVFNALGGWNERFINGGEDHDLFFRALEIGRSFAFVDTPVIHYSSQSAGRFDYEAENYKTLREIWPTERLARLFTKK
jgi:hypothetical protein